MTNVRTVLYTCDKSAQNIYVEDKKMKEKIFIKETKDPDVFRIILLDGPIPPEIMQRENLGLAK